MLGTTLEAINLHLKRYICLGRIVCLTAINHCHFLVRVLSVLQAPILPGNLIHTTPNLKMKSCFMVIAYAATLASAINVSFDTTYDNSGQSLDTVACSTGSNGLITRGFTTFGSLPTFPRIGGAPAVTGFNSAGCGTCWSLTFTNGQGKKTTIVVTAIDVATPDFNISLEAMNQLTGGQAEQIGRAPITAVQVAASQCGL